MTFNLYKIGCLFSGADLDIEQEIANTMKRYCDNEEQMEEYKESLDME